MLANSLNGIAAVLVPLIMLTLILRKWVSLDQDLLFLGFVAIVIIYLHIAPLLSSFELTERERWTYLFLQAASVLLFEAPLIWYYLRRMPRGIELEDRTTVHHPVRALNLTRFRSALVATIVVILSVSFLWISLKYNILFRRMGHEGLAEHSLRLSLPTLIIYRSYVESSDFLSLMLLFLYYHLGAHPSESNANLVQRWSIGFALLVHTFIYGLFILINNRFQCSLFLFFNFLAFCYWRPRPKKAGKIFTVRRLAVFVLLLLAANRMVVNLRLQLAAHVPVSAISALDVVDAPTDQHGVPLAEEPTPMKWRLNGIDLMAKITRPALDRGFLWGKAWETPLLLYVYKFTDPATYDRIKREAKTNPKTFMMSHYLGSEKIDYFSSALTDLYGNFFLFAFPLAGLLFGYLLSLTTLWLFADRDARKIFLSLHLLPIMYYFEKEWITMFLNALKFLPLPLIIYFVVSRVKSEPRRLAVAPSQI